MFHSCGDSAWSRAVRVAVLKATSALDEAAEKTVYKKLLAHVASVNGALVSIAHKPSVAAFHNRQWTLVKQPDGGAAAYDIKASSDTAVTPHA